GSLGIDRGGVAAAPVAPRHRADLHRHPETVAVVEIGAAHLGMVPWIAEVAPPPFGIRFETAAREHHGLGVERGDAVGAAGDDAIHATALSLREARRAGVVEYLDVRLLGRLEPG